MNSTLNILIAIKFRNPDHIKLHNHMDMNKKKYSTKRNCSYVIVSLYLILGWYKTQVNHETTWNSVDFYGKCHVRVWSSPPISFKM